MSNYTRWYREGSINITSGGNTVTGSGTFWKTAELNPGDILKIDGNDYEILTVNSDTSITIAGTYTGASKTGAAYAIVRNFTATTPSKVAAQAAGLLTDFQKHIDTEMDRITGKSAFEVAVDNGYVGTAAQWLESLKGRSAYQQAVENGYAGTQAQWVESLKGENAYQLAVANGYTGTVTEWLDFLRNGGGFTDLVSKIEPITYHHAGAHNSIYRGKNLGTSFTPAMYNEIHNGTYRDLYIGDYLELPIDGTTKAIFTGFGLNNQTGKGAFLWFQNNSWKFPINDTNTLEGGYIASKMYTETLPALLEKIEAVIDPSYICVKGDTLSDTLNSNGDVSHTTMVTGLKLFLPAPNNFAACASTNLGQNVYKLTANANYYYFSGLVWPYALFAPRPYYDAAFWSSSNYNASSWLTIGWCGNYCGAAGNSDTTVFTWPYIMIV